MVMEHNSEILYYVTDVVNANVMTMDSNITHGFFNVGTNTSIRPFIDLAKTVIEYSGVRY